MDMPTPRGTSFEVSRLSLTAMFTKALMLEPILHGLWLYQPIRWHQRWNLSSPSHQHSPPFIILHNKHISHRVQTNEILWDLLADQSLQFSGTNMEAQLDLARTVAIRIDGVDDSVAPVARAMAIGVGQKLISVSVILLTKDFHWCVD